MKTIVVTGGAGFIGSSFIQLLKMTEKNTRIVNLDSLTYAGSIENVPEWIREDAAYHFVHGDIRNRDVLVELFACWHPDAVVNFSAECHVDRSIESAGLFLETNVMGLGHLMDAARVVWKKKREVRFVQISTDEVYGPVEAGKKVDESAPLAPGNPYAASKAAADLLALSYHNTYGFPVMITRCTNNYGPRQHAEKLIPTVLRHLKEDREVPLYGDGLQVRDWIHVEDHCAAILAVLQSGTPGRVYNVAGNQERTNLAMVKQLASLLGMENPPLARTPDRPGHDRRYGVDDSRIREELGWSPRISLEDGLRDLVLAQSL